MTACNLAYGLMVEDQATAFTNKAKLRAHIDEILGGQDTDLKWDNWGLQQPRPLKDRLVK